ncbi:hypothetical protein GYH30_054060 [Glycine max]|nr:hypothetical protein GYH30_054060 [Glycine max]
MQLEALQLAVELGADFIEVQLKAASCLPTLVEHKRNHNSHGKIIVSCYVDGIIPPQEELLQLVELMQGTIDCLFCWRKRINKPASKSKIWRVLCL